MLKIRLQRTGRKNIPFYRIVVAEHSASAKSKSVEQLGFYNPLVKPWQFQADTDRILEWIKKGAKPSNTVARLLKASGVKGMEGFIIEMKDRRKKGEEAPVANAEVQKKEDPAPAEPEAEKKEDPAPAEPEAEKKEDPSPAEEKA